MTDHPYTFILRWFPWALILTFIVLTALDCDGALAHHNQPPILPGVLDPSPSLKQFYADGEFTYALDSRLASYPRFREQAREVAQAYLDNVGVVFREAAPGERVDIWMLAPLDADFLSTCGQGAAACVDYYNSPSTVWFRLALGYFDWKTTIAHEWGHILGMHEQYDDKNFRCLTDRTWTVMSCGTGVWRPTTFDRDVIWGVMVPDAACRVKFISNPEGWAWIEWHGATRCDGGAAHFGSSRIENASRVAFAWAPDATSDPVWTGVWVPGAHDPFTKGWAGFDPSWRGCLYYRFENAGLWWVPQPSAPWYWSLAGCWGRDAAVSLIHLYWGAQGADAVCIAEKESSLNQWAVGSTFGERGLYQIHPVHQGDYIPALGYTWDDMFQVIPNIDVAYSLYRDRGWSPWSVRRLCGV